jgi:hypothetical protein
MTNNMIKPIQINLDTNKLAPFAKALPAAHLGTAMMIMASLQRDNHEAVQLLAPAYDPVCIRLSELGWIRLDEQSGPVLTDTGRKIVATFTARGAKESERAKAVNGWIKGWIAKWPRIKQAGTGLFLATNEKNLLKKMKWFVDEYEFSPNEIELATIQYLQHHYQQGWQQVRQATYFIYREDQSKVRQSDLASWCDMIRHPSQQQTNRFSRTLN